ncbi:hypothetical protein HanXRQr2_Chr06g0256391 [Helianthus annuus]|uniref:Uncharacterized protein n=1 Tax=Helianthus annuus TaxID=4232 RepID=A0A9K3NJ31_HELAN|nr:hypothetical protein HanXRQr2_Chr06g0256391 [Helianthus annuus]KAJ0915223.1 hypothetical protein HanPSC8_Chr06g0247451 [Helianthus annuus]
MRIYCLKNVLLLCIRRVSQGISDSIVDSRQTSGIWVPNPSHLCRAASHHSELIISGMTG